MNLFSTSFEFWWYYYYRFNFSSLIPWPSHSCLNPQILPPRIQLRSLRPSLILHRLQLLLVLFFPCRFLRIIAASLGLLKSSLPLLVAQLLILPHAVVPVDGHAFAELLGRARENNTFYYVLVTEADWLVVVGCVFVNNEVSLVFLTNYFELGINVKLQYLSSHTH